MGQINNNIKRDEKILISMANLCRGNLGQDEKLNMDSAVKSAAEEIMEAGMSAGVEVLAVDEVRAVEAGNVDLKSYWKERKSIRNLLMLCKKNAVMPYYLSKITAVVVENVCVGGIDTALDKIVKKKSFKAGLFEAFDLDLEPQLLEMVDNQYKKIKSGSLFSENKKKIALIKDAYQKGFKYEQKYSGCAQCSLAALCDVAGVEKEPVFLSSTLLSGGGCSCTDGSCGAYNGSLMFLSRNALGRSWDAMMAEDAEIYGKAAEIGRVVHQKFIDTYGTVICREIHKGIFGRAYRIWEEKDKELFLEAGAHEEKCPSVVSLACAWAMEVFIDKGFVSLA